MPSVLFEQFVEEGLGCASYLIGDEQTGEAVVVDPAYAVEQYLETAERKGVHLTRCWRRTRTPTTCPATARSRWSAASPSTSTPGGGGVPARAARGRQRDPRRQQSSSCAARSRPPAGAHDLPVVDHTRADEPWIALTGDSLFVGDTARPDLAIAGDEGASILYHTLHEGLLQLADGVEVFPGHVAGSLCGRGMSAKASTTIGFERRFNPSLAHTELADFIGESAASSGTPRPPNMERIVELNRGMFVGARPPLTRLSSADGATILDVRHEDEFARGHVPARTTSRRQARSRPRPGSSWAATSE